MDKSQTIPVQSEFDVFMARMQAREMAREIGFDAMNQARIALATSSLACALRLGEMQQGQVTLNCLERAGDWGMRVDCTTASGVNGRAEPWAFADLKWLVDELVVKELPSNNVQVTLFALMPRYVEKRSSPDEKIRSD